MRDPDIKRKNSSVSIIESLEEKDEVHWREKLLLYEAKAIHAFFKGHYNKAYQYFLYCHNTAPWIGGYYRFLAQVKEKKMILRE